MAIIVQDQENGNRYILLGAGLGMYKSSRPGVFGGSLFPHEEEGIRATMAVSDANGRILFIDKSHLKVVVVDGINIEDLGPLLESSHMGGSTVDHQRKAGHYLCKNCKTNIKYGLKECPECGMRVS